MKIEQVKTWKMAGKVAAVVALGAVAAAQSAQGDGTGDVRKGQALKQVSMENDIRTPEGARGKIILERPGSVSMENDLRTPEPARGMIILERPGKQQERPLQLVLKMRPRAGSRLDALMPSMDDMETSLVLENGTPGGMAVIHLEVRRGGGSKIVGFFDEDGTFQAELPAGFQAHEVFARGEEALVRIAHGGLKVPASKRPTTDGMDVEQIAVKEYSNFARSYAENYTNLQFKGGAKLRSASLGAGHAVGTAGSLALTPSAPALGGGHVQPGTGVEDDADVGQDVILDLPDPVGGKRAFGKIQLQRPQEPTQRDGHTLQHKL